MDKKIQDILSKMTLEEKISLCNGADFWHSKAMEQYGIPAITMSDGPHGVRCQKDASDMLGVNRSEPATCFPTAVTSGATWDAALLKAEGKAIGEEGLSYGVDVVLGPGVNIKRNPLCGRNFEYFSEDPCIAGAMGAAWVQGAQSTGAGTSLKHFAANNQEYKRFNGNSQVDERTLRELYLPAFETVIKAAQPETVMCSYPRINNVHASDNHWLLTDVLRKDWGFAGLVVTDWGALCDRVKAMHAGCDLSMPGGSTYMEDWVAAAVRDGTLPESNVDACAARVIALALKGESRPKGRAFDKDAHNALAQKIAENGAVLLKNEDNILPLDAGGIALIGEMARTMRYQGAGSSHINPTMLTTLCDALPAVPFNPGCDEKGNVTEESLAAAAAAAKQANIAVVCAGLPDIYESEGFDRETMAMPEGHNRLIETVAAANPNTVVVLFCGCAVETPWLDKVKAVLYMGLPGQAGGAAAANLLTGKANPSGKLTETWPLCYADVPSRDTFGKKVTHYKEGLYVGYRYYQTAGVPVAFPFGYGLSYTSFAYSNLQAASNGVTLTVTNTGKRAGAEIVQLYVAKPGAEVFRPAQELKGFARVQLQPGESKTVTIPLDDKAFRYWNTKTDSWEVEGGSYEIRVGASSADIRLTAVVEVAGTEAPNPYAGKSLPHYESGKVQSVPDAEWETLMGCLIPEDKVRIDRNMTLGELNHSRSPICWLVWLVLHTLLTASYKRGKPDLNVMFQYNMPLRALAKMTNGAISMGMVDGIVMEAKGFWIIGLCRVIVEAVKNVILNVQLEGRLRNS